MPKEPKIKASSTLIDITGLPPGVTWTQEGDTITFSEPIFMEKKETIKALLEGLGTIECKGVFGELAPLNTWRIFRLLSKRIKSLRKENKWLKKERERLLFCKQHYERMILSSHFAEVAENMINSMPVPDGLERIALPVAEFKCAKTNSPSKTCQHYLCIVAYDDSLFYESIWYDSPSFRAVNIGKTVIAFTETEPGEIVNALKPRNAVAK